MDTKRFEVMDLPPVEPDAMPPVIQGPPAGWTRLGAWFIRNQRALVYRTEIVSETDFNKYRIQGMPIIEYVAKGVLLKHANTLVDNALINLHAEKMTEMCAIRVEMLFSTPWNCAHKSLFGIDD